MKFEIDEKIKKETRLCNINFACLAGSAEVLCKVEEFKNGCVLCLKPQCKMPCHYNILIDGLFFCSCPTRNEIYRKYSL